MKKLMADFANTGYTAAVVMLLRSDGQMEQGLMGTTVPCLGLTEALRANLRMISLRSFPINHDKTPAPVTKKTRSKKEAPSEASTR